MHEAQPHVYSSHVEQDALTPRQGHTSETSPEPVPPSNTCTFNSMGEGPYPGAGSWDLLTGHCCHSRADAATGQCYICC